MNPRFHLASNKQDTGRTIKELVFTCCQQVKSTTDRFWMHGQVWPAAISLYCMPVASIFKLPEPSSRSAAQMPHYKILPTPSVSLWCPPSPNAAPPNCPINTSSSNIRSGVTLGIGNWSCQGCHLIGPSLLCPSLLLYYPLLVGSHMLAKRAVQGAHF